MRKRFIYTALGVLMFASMALTACGERRNNSLDSSDSSGGTSSSGTEEEWISSDWTEMPENTNENLKYFGYFHSDGFGSKQGSYVEEIASLGNANIAMINSAFSVDEAVKDLTDVREAGMKAILSVHGLTRGGATGQLGTAHLQDNYQEIWADYQEQIQSFIDDGTIYAFYFDEPRWNGLEAEDFRELTKYLRDTVPTVGTMACMTAMDIGIGNYGGLGECEDNYLEYCTDVMFDSYADWDDEDRREYLDKLKAKAPDEAWIWGCPKGFEAEPEINGIRIMEEHIKGQYTEAIQDERYAGIISFSYANGTEEGDWGFGLDTFFDDQNDYYSKELKDLYTEIGCEITGMTPPETSDLNFIVKEATQTYKVGDNITLPEATASDSAGSYTPTASVTAPDDSAVTVTDNAFTAVQSGNYKVTYTVTAGGTTVEKSVNVYVKSELEIATFEHAASINDVTGSVDDLWCWPREVDSTFGRESSGSLKVTPHATAGTWPNVYFKYGGSETVDMTKYGGVSMWLYNTSDEPIESFGIKVNNLIDGAAVEEYAEIIPLPAKTWTQFTLSTAKMAEVRPNLDLTQVRIALSNSGSSYTNRAVFYIDDVYFLEGESSGEDSYEPLTFENAASAADVTGTEADLWCWPRAVDLTFGHESGGSLKVTPHATDGDWPNVVFKFGGSETVDLTGIDKISAWVYLDSEDSIETFCLKVIGGGKEYTKIQSLPGRVWTEFTLTVAEIEGQSPDLDLTQAQISFSNTGDQGKYTNRSAFYIDDVSLVQSSGEDSDDGATELTFESADDLSAVAYSDAGSMECWPVSIGTEYVHGGSSSLKVTPHATNGTWPIIIFKLGGDTFDMTDYEKVSLWVYNPSDTEIKNFGISVMDSANKQVDCVANIPAGEWVELSVTKAALLEEGADITALSLRFANHDSVYANRTIFYIDDVKLS